MFNLGDVFVRLLLGNSDFRSQVEKEAGAAGDSAGKTLGQKIKGALGTALGAGLGVAFVGAVGAASNFEDKLRTINTVAKLSDAALAQVGEGIKQISNDTGKSLDDLTSGFYDLVSAGVPADKALEVLKNSAVLATGALGSTGEAVDIVTSTLNAFQMDASKSAQVTNVLAQAVADGKTTLSDLAQGFSRVAPIANAAGISFNEVAAATAVMTLKGATASQAYSDIQASISALLTPNAALADIAKRTGVNFADLARQKGLAVALDELRKATKGNNEEFAKALGSSEALTFALSVTGDNAGALQKELENVANSGKDGGVAMQQFAEKMKSPVEQGKRLVAQVQSFLVTVGGPFVSTLGPAIFALNQLGAAFGLNGIAAKAFGGIIGGLTGRLIPGILKSISGAEIGTRAETLGIQFATKFTDPLKDKIAYGVKGALGAIAGVVSSGAGAFKGLWEKVLGSSVVGPIAQKAGAAAVAAYLKATAFGDALTGLLTRAWSAATGPVVAAAERLGLASFAAVAAPFAIPIIATIVIAAVLPPGPTWKEVKDQATADLSKIDWGTVFGLDKTWDRVGENATSALARGVSSGVAKARPTITLAIKGLFGSDLAAQSSTAIGWATRIGNLAGGAVAQAIEAKRQTVDQAWQDLLSAIKNSQSSTRRTALLLGELASKDLIKGLHNGDPAARAQARYTKQLILDQLAELKPRAGTLSKEAMANLKKAMNSSDPQIRQAARDIYAAATHPLSGLPAAGTKIGKNTGQALADGLDSKLGVVAAAAFRLVQAALAKFNTSGLLGDKHRATGGPVKAGQSYIVGEHHAETFVPDHDGYVLPFAVHPAAHPKAFAAMPHMDVSPSAISRGRGVQDDQGAGAGSGVYIGELHLHDIGNDVSPQRAANFGRQIMREVASSFRHDGARNGLHPARP